MNSLPSSRVEPTKTPAPSEDATKSSIQPNELPGIYEKSVDSTQTVFWGDNPNVLMQSMDFFPSNSMTFVEQINALTRGILMVSILLSFLFQRISFLVIGCGTVFLVWVYYVSRKTKKEGFKEGFTDAYDAILHDLSGDVVEDAIVFDIPRSRNPFANVLVTDYMDRPNKLPAPPIEESKTSDDILEKAKLMVQQAHPNFPDISDRLFSNLGDNYQFEQSMQPFYSNSVTTIPSDRKAFTDFCYGDLISCKEGNLFACARNLPRYGEGS